MQLSILARNLTPLDILSDERITRTLVSHLYFKRTFVIRCDTLKTTAQKTVTDKYSNLVPIPLIPTDNSHYI